MGPFGKLLSPPIQRLSLKYIMRSVVPTDWNILLHWLLPRQFMPSPLVIVI